MRTKQQAAAKPPRRSPGSRPLHQQPEAITVVRERSGLSRKQLSDMTGLSLSFVCEIEKGTRSARAEVLAKIAEALNCPVVVLERKRDDFEPETAKAS